MSEWRMTDENNPLYGASTPAGAGDAKQAF